MAAMTAVRRTAVGMAMARKPPVGDDSSSRVFAAVDGGGPSRGFDVPASSPGTQNNPLSILPPAAWSPSTAIPIAARAATSKPGPAVRFSAASPPLPSSGGRPGALRSPGARAMPTLGSVSPSKAFSTARPPALADFVPRPSFTDQGTSAGSRSRDWRDPNDRGPAMSGGQANGTNTLIGELIIDGRQLGTIVAKEQARQATLPSARSSAIDAGSMPLYPSHSMTF